MGYLGKYCLNVHCFVQVKKTRIKEYLSDYQLKFTEKIKVNLRRVFQLSLERTYITEHNRMTGVD